MGILPAVVFFNPLFRHGPQIAQQRAPWYGDSLAHPPLPRQQKLLYLRNVFLLLRRPNRLHPIPRYLLKVLPHLRVLSEEVVKVPLVQTLELAGCHGADPGATDTAEDATYLAEVTPLNQRLNLLLPVIYRRPPLDEEEHLVRCGSLLYYEVPRVDDHGLEELDAVGHERLRLSLEEGYPLYQIALHPSYDLILKLGAELGQNLISIVVEQTVVPLL
mmetsp:Transcript_1956/g.3918  ORF Transcript_1956/g.3918 Transcript_1956/m.3918 type:complete len:217 (-) Transcript_1956:1850-2500(-)